MIEIEVIAFTCTKCLNYSLVTVVTLTVSNVDEEILINSCQIWYSTSEQSTRCCRKVDVIQNNRTRVPSSGIWNNS